MFRIPLARPSLGSEEAEATSAVLGSGRLVCGPRVEAFEGLVARRVGVPHAVAFSSGTSALWAALRCLGVGAGDEVIVPALTFPATVEAVIFNDATPVLADVDPATFNMDHRDLAGRFTRRTKAVIAVDQFGVPADYPGIEDVIGRHPGVHLVEDAACSLGSSLDGRPCGSFGEASVLSFHPRKIVTTGEGGMVCTDHDGLAGCLRQLRSHGQDREGRFVLPGLNLRMGEVAGALGAVQMDKLDGFLEQRRVLFDEYRRHLKPEIRPQECPATASLNFQTLAAVLPDRVGPGGRDLFIERMRSSGIEVSIASFCIPTLPAYAHLAIPGDFPGAMRIHGMGIALPMFAGMKSTEVEEVARAAGDVLEAVGRGS